MGIRKRLEPKILGQIMYSKTNYSGKYSGIRKSIKIQKIMLTKEILSTVAFSVTDNQSNGQNVDKTRRYK